MDDVEFTNEDFDNLASIEKFNKEHWKGKGTDLGWKYDVDKKDHQISKIRDSLTRIKNKLERIRSYFQEKEEFKHLESKVQKITDSRTNRYLFHLWIYFVKGFEKKAPNEPQLQLTIRPQDINISLWFENALANRKYLSNFIENYSEYIKKDNQISIEVYEPGIGSKALKIFSNKEWISFVNQLSDLDNNCKVGFTYFIPKEEVLKKGPDIITSIEERINRMKLYFENATRADILMKSKLDVFRLLSKKKQVILYGPPGTGKTFKTMDFAVKFLNND